MKIPCFSVLVSSLLIASAHASDPKDVFAEHCASCHGVDGKAKTPAGRKLGARDLSESKLPDAEISRQIANGTRNDKGTQRMPPFKDKLPPAEIDLLVAYVKAFRRP